ncbi:MAG: carbohydrate ABC transporter permease [Lachnospiraceae bacterium]|nr:carbohydrate ABC transporter permease [Lachnospiraceae bacterium]MDD3616667.1 carbohydrate ABC transporter permease [Lachnospiraceae bacterium]
MIEEKKTNSAGRIVGSIIKLVLVIAVFVMYMFPFIMIIVNSFKQKRDIVKTPLAILGEKGNTIENYIKGFEKMNFPQAFANSALITVISVILIILGASMCAYIMVREDWKANKIVFALMMFSMVIPFQVLMIPEVSIYGNILNLLNHRGTLIFMNIGFNVSMGVFMYHGFIKSGIPVSLEEAARLDGCTRVQTFFKIVFPLLKPTTATLVILYSMAIWNDFLLPSLVLGRKNLYTLPIATRAFYGTYSTDLGLIMASLVMTVIPIIILYLVLQKYIIEGVVAGAVKS